MFKIPRHFLLGHPEKPYRLIIPLTLALGAGSAVLIYNVGVSWFLGFLACVVFSLFFLEKPEWAILFFIIVINSLWVLQGEIGSISVGIGGVLNFSLTIVGIFYILQKRVNLRSTPIALPFFFLVAVSLISIFHSPDKLHSMRWSLRFFSIFVIYCLVLDIFNDKARINRIYLAMVFSLTIPLIMGGWGYINKTGMVDLGGFIRISSTFNNPVPTGIFIMICLSSVLVLLFSNTPNLIKLLVGIIGLASLGLLYLTYTRVAWMGTLLMIVLFGLLVRRRSVLWLLIFILILAALTPGVWQRLESFLKPIPGLLEPGLNWRIHNLKQAFFIFLERPLIGHGGGTSRDLMFVKYGSAKLPHNGFLTLAIELGLLGLVCFLAILFILMKQAFWVYRNSGDEYLKVLASAYLAILGGWMLGNMFHHLSPPYGVVLSILILGALIGSAERLCREGEPR